MNRWLLNLLTASSLLLCSAALGLWVRSHGRNDCIGRRVVYDPGDDVNWGCREVAAASSLGSLYATWVRSVPSQRTHWSRRETVGVLRKERPPYGWAYKPRAWAHKPDDRWDPCATKSKRSAWNRAGFYWTSWGVDGHGVDDITFLIVPHW